MADEQSIITVLRVEDPVSARTVIGRQTERVDVKLQVLIMAADVDLARQKQCANLFATINLLLSN